jgi:chloride channel protein, CIC family
MTIDLLRGFDWRTRLLGSYLRKWVILGVLIGIVAGLGAIAFFAAIQWSTKLFLGGIAGLTPPVPRGEDVTQVTSAGRPWLFPVVTTLGGLLSGLIVFTLAPEAEGHGTDAAIRAFHQLGGKIRSRIPPIKLLASAITIGSGGSGGREGPTAQISAGFGSWLGDAFQLSPQDRRIALAVGVGAGIGAIFKAPLGGAILSAEILYIHDFELEAIIPGFIASVIGYSIFAAWSGWTPVFGRGLALQFNDPKQLIWYALLGVAAGVVGIAYVRFFYWTRDAFRKLRIPPHFKPAIGGLGVGLIALAFPQVLSMGYGWLQLAIEGNTGEIAVHTMLILVALKIVATSLSISSGGSGGVFAPGLFIGGMLGGAMWGMLHGHVAWMPPQSAPFVIVGMMALFGGVAKAPIAVMLMVAEMTNEFSMVVPAMLATTVAYVITGDTRIYEHQVPTRADSPAHRGEYTIPLIQTVTAEQAMKANVTTCSPDDTVQEAERRMTQQRRRGLPVVKDGKLIGIFTASDAMRANQKAGGAVDQHMTTNLVVAHPTDSLHDVMQRMAGANISRVPVVDPQEPDKLLGILSNRDIAAALDLEVNALAAASRGVVELAGRARALASDGNFASMSIRIRSSDRSAGRTLAELSLPADCVVTGVYRNGTFLIPRGGLRLERADRVQVLAAQSVRRKVLACLRGD